MNTKMNRKAILTAGAAATLLIAGCSPAADPAQDATAESAIDGSIDGAIEEGAEGDMPDAQPTASIFGPEAGVPEPEQENATEPLKVIIGFPDGGAALDADAVAELEKALGSEQLRGAANGITLRAHSDASGTNTANLDASEQRGLAVAAWLIERGISEDRIEVIAFGAQNPAQPNAMPDGSPNELGRAANRRVEMVVVPRKAEAKPTGKEPEAQ